MVSVGTFDWHSIQPTLRRMPKSETTVKVSTAAINVLSHNLAIGVVAGVLVAVTLFAAGGLAKWGQVKASGRQLLDDAEEELDAFPKLLVGEGVVGVSGVMNLVANGYGKREALLGPVVAWVRPRVRRRFRETLGVQPIV